jgi:NADH-quinone oxidoreductase subunit J
VEPAIVLFWLFAATAFAGAIGVVTMRQPVHSALSLLLTFLAVAALFVLNRAEFIAAVQVLVYAGGIMVLFLFTIMLVNVKRTEREPYIHRQAAAALGVGLLLLAIVGSLVVGASGRAGEGLLQGSAIAAAAPEAGNSQAVGWLLYRDYVLPFEIASVFLLVAMIGAVVLGKRTMEKFD